MLSPAASRSVNVAGALIRTAVLYWCVLSLTFVLLRMAPGDPATFLLPPNASAADAVRLRAALGLEQPVTAQYARWTRRMLHGDLGTSFSEGRPVVAVLRDALPVSLALGGASLLLSFLVGATVGIVQSARRGTYADFTLTIISVVLAASPAYWLRLPAVATQHVRQPDQRVTVSLHELFERRPFLWPHRHLLRSAPLSTPSTPPVTAMVVMPLARIPGTYGTQPLRPAVSAAARHWRRPG